MQLNFIFQNFKWLYIKGKYHTCLVFFFKKENSRFVIPIVRISPCCVLVIICHNLMRVRTILILLKIVKIH